MKKVLLRGPILSKSGYGEHARQVFRYLLEKPNIDVRTELLPWGITPWDLNEKSCGGLVGEAINRSADIEKEKFDVSIQVQLPNEWDTSRGKVNIGVTAGVETDVSNPTWSSTHVMKMDKVIVPSNHTKKSLTNDMSMAEKKITVVREGYYEELLQEQQDKTEKLNISTEFNFLTVGTLTGERPETDRKNLFYLIKWFLEAFNGDKTTGLIVKTSRGRNTAIDKKWTKSLLKNLLKELNHTGTPSVYLLHGDMSREDMNGLYRDESVKAFVSLTRGEGFGLPHLEAAVSGLPVIATNWSAHTEFLNLGKWISIDYELSDIDPERVDNQIFMAGSKWANPLEEDFKSKVLKFRKSFNTPSSWAKKLSETLKEEYSWNNIRNQYEEAIGEFFR
jgi:glycosyltransferase involved in cell wall biosynthesis